MAPVHSCINPWVLRAENPPNMCEEKILGFYMCHLQIWELFNNNYLCTYDLYGPMRNAFDAGSIHYLGI